MGWIIIVAALLLAAPSIIAVAQGIDPRLATAAVQKLQGDLAFADVRLRIAQEDAEVLRVKLCAAIPEDKRPAECTVKAADAK